MRHKCPICKKVIDGVLQEQSRREKFYPFCSQRCKWIDLGRWIDGDYRIITELKQADDEQKTEDPASLKLRRAGRGQRTDDGEMKTVDNPQKTGDNYNN